MLTVNCHFVRVSAVVNAMLLSLEAHAKVDQVVTDSQPVSVFGCWYNIVEIACVH